MFCRWSGFSTDFDSKIARLQEFRSACETYAYGRLEDQRKREIRRTLNENTRAVRRDVMEAGCYKTLTIGPPPIVGGPIAQNVDPILTMFSPPYGANVLPVVLDMLEQAIGVLRDPDYQARAIENSTPKSSVTVREYREGYVFIAMPMAGSTPAYDDVHDAIKTAADTCGLQAERVDDVQSNERITDRLLQSIRSAEFVVADLTDAKPNVFYEAGYAFGIGKMPIYVAREGTKPEFDIKDYPIIFFDSMRSLRSKLEQRFASLISARKAREGKAPAQ